MFISFDPASPRLRICPSKEVSSEMFTGGTAGRSKRLEMNEMSLDRELVESVVAKPTTEHQAVYPRRRWIHMEKNDLWGHEQVKKAGLT